MMDFWMSGYLGHKPHKVGSRMVVVSPELRIGLLSRSKDGGLQASD
jgi:hypothetical protein